MRVTLSLIGICVIVFILQGLWLGFTEVLALTPSMALNGLYWQFLTYMFLHESPMHLMLNMFILFIFGVTVERVLGLEKYLFLYLISGIGSGIFYILLTGYSNILMLGASGAVYGVLTAYAFLFPKNPILIFPFPIPIPAALLVVFFALISIFYGVFSLQQGIAHFGHLGGIIFGFLFMLHWRKKKKQPRFEFIWE